ncbi:MAG TPA: hypothetical protein VFA89_04255 [Terriglobales bacterium]|nr:hypothetical protein [Terriglobales bacterium]
MNPIARLFWCIALVCAVSTLFNDRAVAASSPAVTVLSPVYVTSGNTGTFSGGSPIHYVAYASSPGCAKGISSMQIYTADGVLAYQTYSSYLDVQLALDPANYHTVIKAWDNCGGVNQDAVDDFVEAGSGTVAVASPISNVPYNPSGVFFVASATSTCPEGVDAMGIYTSPFHRVYTVKGNSMNTFLTLPPGTYDAVVEEWDKCGGAATTPVTLVVNPKGMPGDIEYAYVANYNSGTLPGFWLSHNTCTWNPIVGSPFPASAKTYQTALDPNGAFAFAINQSPPSLSVYSLARQLTGGLTQVPASPLPISEPPGYLPTGVVAYNAGLYVFVYVSNGSTNHQENGFITGYQVNNYTGEVSTIEGSPFYLTGNSQPTTMAVNGPLGSLTWVYTGNGSSISAFSMNQATGELTEVSGSPFPAPGRFGPSAGILDMTVVRLGYGYLFTANAEDSISDFQVEKNGELFPLSESPYPSPDRSKPGNPASVTASPLSSNFLYGMNAGSDDVSVWQLDTSNGALTYLREEQQGKLLTSVGDQMRTVSDFPHPDCMVTSNGYSLAVNTTTGETALNPASPFLPLGGIYPGISVVLVP